MYKKVKDRDRLTDPSWKEIKTHPASYYQCEICGQFGLNNPKDNLYYGTNVAQSFHNYVIETKGIAFFNEFYPYPASFCPKCVESLWDEFFEKKIPSAMQKTLKIKDRNLDFIELEELIRRNPQVKALLLVLLESVKV